jgi:hypothetical protein
MVMGRPKTYTDEELIALLANIHIKYGYIGVDTMQKAYADAPFEFPSYKMFERRLGGMKNIGSAEFRKNKLFPEIDKISEKM